jgi:hypothetical protein
VFDFFNRKTAKDFMEQAQETYQAPPAKDECLYTVGTTQSGQTVLKLVDGYMTMSLTMNDVAVRKMIRLLEATLEEEQNEQN